MNYSYVKQNNFVFKCFVSDNSKFVTLTEGYHDLLQINLKPLKK